MLSIFLISAILGSTLRFCALPEDIQSLKSNTQIKNKIDIVSTFFTFKPKDHPLEHNQTNIFLYLDGKQLATYVQIDLKKCHFQDTKKELPYINVYCVTVLEKYRGQGLGSKIIIDAVDYLKKRHNLSEETIIALHLSPNDIMMPYAAIIYYKLGFTKGLFNQYGPPDYEYRMEELFANSMDFFKVADNPEICKYPGHFFLTYCKLKDLKIRNNLPENAVERAKSMYNILKDRKEKDL